MKEKLVTMGKITKERKINRHWIFCMEQPPKIADYLLSEPKEACILPTIMVRIGPRIREVSGINEVRLICLSKLYQGMVEEITG
jgi:hypothetical protein